MRSSPATKHRPSHATTQLWAATHPALPHPQSRNDPLQGTTRHPPRRVSRQSAFWPTTTHRTMLGRQVTNTLLRVPTRRLALRPATFQDLASRATVFLSLRSYATPGRPRTAVGEPSRPVKRAVKRDARSADGGEAKKRVQARKASAKAKKKAPKKPVKKVLTPEQQAKKEAKAASTKVKELKKTALKPPTTGQRVTAYNVFIGEHTRGRKASAGQSAPEALKEANAEWKTLSPADIEVR